MFNPVKSLYVNKTLESFNYQWGNLPSGNALLSDKNFSSKVSKILCEEELCLREDWFKGKKVLDAGCGNGRWTYGFLKLGAKVTAVDYSQNAVNIVKKQLGLNKNLRVEKVDLLRLPNWLKKEKFDLVFSWGVLHHTGNIEKAMKNLAPLVKNDGLIYVYLYGEYSNTGYDSATKNKVLNLAKKLYLPESLALRGLGLAKGAYFFYKVEGRLVLKRTLLLPFPSELKKNILSKFYKPEVLHQAFDALATPLNQRLNDGYVVNLLHRNGFKYVVRTINLFEVFMKGYRSKNIEKYFTTPKNGPYWFQKFGY